ncbi:uncharacterized protein LOC106661971 [Cimex lectularius]|uniref:Uncharacterized protein n=1 Tax=Cimex lectularius TaxID=79782 RepID=A0A8I6R9U6_CIMLE|nr:uncharacterized protein LOC106661971 [Cimex lectularius]
MGNYVWILVLLSFTAYAGGNVVEEALEYVRTFAEEIRSGIKQITDAGNDSKTTIINHHDNYKSQLQEYTHNYVLQAKIKAGSAKCENRVAVFNDLDEVVLMIGDRWDRCVQLTTKIENLVYYLRNTSNVFREMETTVCDAIQDVSRCHGNFLQKWACVSSELRKNSGRFEDEGKKFLLILGGVNSYMEGIVQLFVSCFMNVKLDVKTLADQVLLSRCNIGL